MKQLKFLCILCFYLSISKAAEKKYTIDYLELEQKNVFLDRENSKLRFIYSYVALKYAKLQKEYFETRQKLKKVSSHFTTLNSNFSVLNDQIATLVESLQTVSENIEPLKRNVYQNDLSKSFTEPSQRKSGTYTIAIPFSNPFKVFLDTKNHEGIWLVIQRRMDGSVDFHRPWLEYKKGFGSLDGEFFIGLDKLHTLTSYVPHELLIVMKDFNDETKYAKYSDFEIGTERELYHLKTLGESSGSAPESLNAHLGNKFSTYDNDNDSSKGDNCAKKLFGGWWYRDCPKRGYENSGNNDQNYRTSNLNGLYLNGSYMSDYKSGVTWDDFYHDYYSLKFVQMMIKPKNNFNSKH